jgi:hypothetical protein
VGSGDNGVNDNRRRNPHNAFRSVGEEGGLIVVPAQSSVEVLNPVGAKIYSMLDGLHTREEILDAVVTEFEISLEQAGRDLDEFLADLEARELLIPADGGEPEGSHD